MADRDAATVSRGPVSDYFAKTSGVSYNAKLYIVHFMLMAFRIGAWDVAFSLYLLDQGFSATFVGARIFVQWFSIAVLALFAGRLCDKIGRRPSFIIGDGLGAFLSIFLAFVLNAPLLIVLSVMAGVFAAIHMVAEDPWMMENSENHERVYLFSIVQGAGRIAIMVGALAAGLIPVALAADGHVSAGAYRVALLLGSAIWFVSLVPAFMFRERQDILKSLRSERGFSFRNLQSSSFIYRILPIYVFYWLGVGLIHPLHNVFFAEKFDASVDEVGIIIMVGGMSMAFGSFVVPVIAEKLGRMRTVTYTLVAAAPFSASVFLAPSLLIAGVFFFFHELTMHVCLPILRAFTMENVETRERATVSGMTVAMHWGGLGIGALFAGVLMDRGLWNMLLMPLVGMFLITIFLSLTLFRGDSVRRWRQVPTLAGESR
ncbi:MAG: MFS transporter [Dehalococcoidia bacterium]